MKVIINLFILFGYSFIHVGVAEVHTEILETELGRPIDMKCQRHNNEHLIWFYKKDLQSGQEEREISKSGRFEIQFQMHEAILTLKHPTYADKGVYMLKQVGKNKHVKCQKILKIFIAPIAHCKADQQMPMKENLDVHLTCSSLGGYPKPTFSWYRVRNLEGTLKKELLVNTSELFIQSATKYASGTYECKLQNRKGYNLCQISVNVIVLPEIEVYESVVRLREVQDTTLMCRVTANPWSPIVWKRGNSSSALYSNHEYDIQEDEDQFDTYYTKYLILTLKAVSLKERIFGEYWCKVTGYDRKYWRQVKVIRTTGTNKNVRNITLPPHSFNHVHSNPLQYRACSNSPNIWLLHMSFSLLISRVTLFF